MKTKQRKCGQRLYQGGKLVAICTEPWGIEHDHSDKTAREAIAQDKAKPVTTTVKQ